MSLNALTCSQIEQIDPLLQLWLAYQSLSKIEGILSSVVQVHCCGCRHTRRRLRRLAEEGEKIVGATPTPPAGGQPSPCTPWCAIRVAGTVPQQLKSGNQLRFWQHSDRVLFDLEVG
ncbi:hypothetical protein [Dictyobacter formicarum]|uniref:hypothetical protein n=1 Tax=Dictyobacter formicarum TaxID=2778368 RepID=UPI0019156D6A|nr:hypothetical protein [Dictyobacter formicarum]